MKTIECLDCVKRTKKDSSETFYAATVTWRDKDGFLTSYSGYVPCELKPGKKYEASIGYKEVTSGKRTYKEPYIVDVSDREVKEK